MLYLEKNMLKIYKNKSTTFKCEVLVETEGQNVKDIKSRLILYPTNDNRNVMYEGVVQDNICSIDINPNVNINKNGKAVLEVIIDDATIFAPWNSTYEIVTETVKVESAQLIYDANKAKVIVNEIKEDQPKKQTKPVVKSEAKKVTPVVKKTKKSFDNLLQEAANMIKDDTEENKKLLKVYNESIKSLPKEDLTKMVKHVQVNYVPTKESLTWAKKVLGETKTTKAKLLMYANEIKNGIK
jgi:hypothetical protein